MSVGLVLCGTAGAFSASSKASQAALAGGGNTGSVTNATEEWTIGQNIKTIAD